VSDSPLPDSWDGAVRWFLGGTIVFALGFEGVTMFLDGKFLVSVASLLLAMGLLAFLVYWPAGGGLLLLLAGMPVLLFLATVEFCKRRKFRNQTLVTIGIGLMLGAVVLAAIGGALIYVSTINQSEAKVTAAQSSSSSVPDLAPGAPKLQPPIKSVPITPNSSHLRTRAEIVAIRNDLLELMQIVDGDIAPLNEKLNEFVVSQPHRVFVDLASVESQAKELHVCLETVVNKLNAFMERHRDDEALHNVMNFSETGDPKVVLSHLEQFTYNIPSASLNHIQISTANIYWGAAYTLRSAVSSKWLVTLRDRVAALRHQLDPEYSTAQ